MGEFAALYLTDAPPSRPGGQPVLLGAGRFAGVAADTGLHGEGEAVLLPGLEGEQCRPGGGERRAGVEDGNGHGGSVPGGGCPVVAASCRPKDSSRTGPGAV